MSVTIDHLLKSKRLTATHSSGFASGVSSNSSRYVHRVTLTYQLKSGEKVRVGQGESTSRGAARQKALEAAVKWFNE